MNYIPKSATLENDDLPCATVHALLSNPGFLPMLQQGARHMIDLYDQFPRVARLVGAQQKWLLTQAAYALHLERDAGNPLTGITAARLLDIIVEFGAASRNTATAFLAEMLAYKFIRDVPGSLSKRSRPLEPTDISDQAMTLWFRGQMRSLDLLDNGRRVAATDADPEIFRRAQPRAAKRLIADRAWREPPESIAAFVWTESGGLILDDLMSRLSRSVPDDGRYHIEQLRFAELSSHFSISRTHVRRLFVRVEALGLIGWENRARCGGLWVHATLVDDYARWQAVKFSALDEAYRAAVRALAAARGAFAP